MLRAACRRGEVVANLGVVVDAFASNATCLAELVPPQEIIRVGAEALIEHTAVGFDKLRRLTLPSPEHGRVSVEHEV